MKRILFILSGIGRCIAIELWIIVAFVFEGGRSQAYL